MMMIALELKKYGYILKNLKIELTFSYPIDAVDSYENKLYIATRTSKKKKWYLTVSILDEDLVMLKSIQQSHLTHLF